MSRKYELNFNEKKLLSGFMRTAGEALTKGQESASRSDGSVHYFDCPNVFRGIYTGKYFSKYLPYRCAVCCV